MKQPQKKIRSNRSDKVEKMRVVDFGDTLADILRKAKKEQHKNRFQYGELYQRNFYREVMEKNRVHYEYYHWGMTESVPEDYTEISFVCLREDGCLELPATIETACRTAGRKVPELEGFHFHTLRHTYTTNLLSNGAQPKDVQAVRTLGCEYHHECLCPCYKGSKADFRMTT